MLNGGSPTYQAGMGSATCMMQTGPTAQTWSCSLTLAIKGLVAIFRANGVGFLFPAGIQGPTDEYKLAQTVCSHHGLGSLGTPVERKAPALPLQQCIGGPHNGQGLHP